MCVCLTLSEAHDNARTETVTIVDTGQSGLHLGITAKGVRDPDTEAIHLDIAGLG